MQSFKTVFKRFEKKYIITAEQREKLLFLLGDRIVPDAYGESTVCNIYFDTPDYRMIRHSIEKDVFKEKIRIRSYGIPSAESSVFLEIKRKCKGVVYKRREIMTYDKAVDILCRGKKSSSNTQFINEIEYMQKFYGSVRPAISIFYDRTAYFAADDDELRITFDNNIRFRNHELDISKGDFGKVIFGKDKSIMEIKCAGAMPLWLTGLLDELEIYPSSYSKYGNSYIHMMTQPIENMEVRI